MTNIGMYVRRESTISQREIMGIKTDRVHFPKILICADSIHSKERTFDAYPMLNMTMIQQLYGLDVPAMAEVSSTVFSGSSPKWTVIKNKKTSKI